MTLEERYYDWLVWLIDDRSHDDYENLLKCLDETEFTFTIDMDGNREGNGIDLRYHFGYEFDINDAEIATKLDNRPCSVLEMLVALSQKLENIMEDPDLGDQTSYWFWTMIDNLGLFRFDDYHWNEYRVKEILRIFLDRKYGPHGDGGLFKFYHNKKDVRGEEIWTQAMWYLEELSERR